MRRRDEPDPELVRMMTDRLRSVLSDARPRRAAATPVEPVELDEDLEGGESLPASLDDLPKRPGFGRWHVGVIAGLVLVGLLSSGWALLRARPVAVASAGPVTASTPAVVTSTPPAAGGPGGGPPGGPSSDPADLVVHVLGAVRRPGLVELPVGSRVQDALDAAGGLRAKADPGELNLARVLSDGEQIVVGTRERPVGEVRDGGGGGGGSGGGGAPGAGSTLDLNHATQAQLEALPGIGPVTAGKILAWRTEHGRFNRVEDLQEVSGIGPKIYAQLAPLVRV